MKLAALSLLIASNIALADVIDVEYPEGMNSLEVASRLLNIDAEMVQIFRVNPTQASELRITLQGGYDNFLYVPSGNLFIASKNAFEILLAKNQESGAKGKVGTRASWGGGKGIVFEVYGEGEVHDRRGNSAKVDVVQRSDGTGDADVSGEHKS